MQAGNSKSSGTTFLVFVITTTSLSMRIETGFRRTASILMQPSGRTSSGGSLPARTGNKKTRRPPTFRR
eukprot:scaffold23191_cov27-Tisochrysis_lutea.AAC.1